MDEQLILAKAINHSRIEFQRQTRRYYEFTEEELLEFTRNIINECIAISESNHSEYQKVAKAISNVVLQNTADLIRNHFGVRQ